MWFSRTLLHRIMSEVADASGNSGSTYTFALLFHRRISRRKSARPLKTYRRGLICRCSAQLYNAEKPRRVRRARVLLRQSASGMQRRPRLLCRMKSQVEELEEELRVKERQAAEDLEKKLQQRLQELQEKHDETVTSLEVFCALQ